MRRRGPTTIWTATFSTWQLHSTPSAVDSRQGRVLVQAECRDGLDLKGEEDVARDKVDAPKPKRRLLDINESDNESDGERERDG